MKSLRITPAIRLGMASASVPTPEQADHLEVRLLTLFLTLSFINDLVGPITYVYSLSPSLLYKVASLAHASWLVGVIFIAALVLAVPLAAALLWVVHGVPAKWTRRAATLAAVLVTLNWCYLAILSLPLDAGPLFWLYLRQAAESLGLAFIYAISLNAQLLRTIDRAVNP
jgi:hypothetical protein